MKCRWCECEDDCWIAIRLHQVRSHYGYLREISKGVKARPKYMIHATSMSMKDGLCFAMAATDCRWISSSKKDE